MLQAGLTHNQHYICASFQQILPLSAPDWMPKVRKQADSNKPAAPGAASLDTCSQKLDFSCFSQTFFFPYDMQELFLLNFERLIDSSAGALSGLGGWAALLRARAAWVDRAAALGGHAPETLPCGSLPPESICLDGVLLYSESSVERTESLIRNPINTGQFVCQQRDNVTANLNTCHSRKIGLYSCYLWQTLSAALLMTVCWLLPP